MALGMVEDSTYGMAIWALDISWYQEQWPWRHGSHSIPDSESSVQTWLQRTPAGEEQRGKCHICEFM